MEKKNTHGGARVGAGRKQSLPDNTRAHSIRMTDAEYELVKKFLAGIREGKFADIIQ